MTTSTWTVQNVRSQLLARKVESVGSRPLLFRERSHG